MTDNLQRLFVQAGRALLGRRVRVVFGTPRTKGATGEAVLDRDGTPLITILPVDDDAELLRLFLHELAHVKLHSADWKPGQWIDTPPGGLDTSWARDIPIIKQREDEANAQADEWLKLASAYAGRMGGVSLEYHLKVLMVPASFWELIDRSAQVGAQAAIKEHLRR